MEKVVRMFSSFAEADAADDEYYRRLSPEERLRILFALRAQTYPEASESAWRELLELLPANDVAFLVVGAIAVGRHGHPHLTHDLDLFIGPSAANIANALAALRQFGFAEPPKAEQVVRIGASPKFHRLSHVPIRSKLRRGMGWQSRRIRCRDSGRVHRRS